MRFCLRKKGVAAKGREGKDVFGRRKGGNWRIQENSKPEAGRASWGKGWCGGLGLGEADRGFKWTTSISGVAKVSQSLQHSADLARMER